MSVTSGRFHLWVEGCAGAGLPVDAFGGDSDGDGAFGSFFEERAVGFLLVLGGVGVDELHVAGAEDLEAVVEVRAGSKGLSSEAGAGVVDLEEEDWFGGTVAYGGFDVGRVAAGCYEDWKERENAEMTHEIKGIRVDEGAGRLHRWRSGFLRSYAHDETVSISGRNDTV
jgi:hypothetical protein